MQRDELDAALLRFVRERDPAALARVFDLAAPKLLLVAEHLARPGVDAADLVQTVFLQVIRDAERFDPERRCMPWLLAILHHRARDAARRDESRNGGTRLPLEEVPGGRSPAELASESEAIAALATALEDLPAEQREVLVLRLVHDLKPIEIAYSKGCSPETIRTRLRRGLEALRRILPRGLRLGALVALLDHEARSASTSLAAMRTRILSRAAELCGAEAVASGSRTIGVPWLLAALATLTALGWWLSSSALVSSPTDGAPIPEAMRTTRRATASSEPAFAERRENVHRARTEAPAVSPADAQVTSIRARVVGDEDGAPRSLVRVELRGSLPGSGRGDLPQSWQDIFTSTNSEGRFELRFAPPHALRFDLSLAEEGRTPQRWHRDSLRAGLEIDLGEIRLRQRVGLVVECVDAGNLPLIAREIWLRPEPDRIGRNHGFSEDWDQRRILQTDERGRAAWPDLPPGRYRYELSTPLVGPREAVIDVPPQSEPLHRRIVFEAPPIEHSISGLAVDEHGVPVAGLPLTLNLGAGIIYEATQRNGAFLFSRASVSDPAQALRLELREAWLDHEWIERPQELRWGRHDVRVQVRKKRSASLELEVVDAESGTAIPRYGLRVQPDGYRLRNGHGLEFGAAPPEARENGKCALRELAPGPHLVSIFPPPPHGERGELAIELREGAHEHLRVELERGAELKVQVREESSGDPAADIELELARVSPPQAASKASLNTYRLDLTSLRRREGGASSAMVLVLDRARTDANGVAVLRAAANTPALVVIAGGRECAAKWTPDVELPRGGASLEIEIARASLVRGTLGPRELVRRFGPSDRELAVDTWEHEDPRRFAEDYPRVELREAGQRSRLLASHVDSSGNFEIPAVPNGELEVWVVISARTSPGSRHELDFGPLQTIRVDTGTAPVGELALDMSAWLPGRIRCAFEADGAPWTGGAGFVHLADVRGFGYSTVECTEGVATESFWLLPGTYAPYVEVPFGISTRKLFGTEAFILSAGETIDVRASLRSRRVALRIVDARGAPYPRAMLGISDPRRRSIDPWCYRSRSDDSGVLVLEPAPPGELEVLWIRGENDAVRVGRVGGHEDEVDIRIPD